MQNETLEFLSRISWPLVVLIGIIILGPAGLLKSLIGELSERLFQITDSVNGFKETAANFHRTQTDLKESTAWVQQLQNQLASITQQIESINRTTQEMAISEGNRTLERSIDLEQGASDHEAIPPLFSADQMYDDIRDRWESLIDKLRLRVGADTFDARSIGQMAWKLTDRRRTEPISHADAQLIENLHSQLKRFNRLQSTREYWLTPDVYSAFVRGVEQAQGAL